MTDRINALVVVLEENIRDDDAQPIIDAIKQLRHVIDVRANVVTISDHIARQQAFTRMRKMLFETFYEEAKE